MTTEAAEPPTVDTLEDYYRRLCNWGRWGPGDERGALNHVTPDKTRRAATLVRRGAVFSLQLPLDAHGPQTGAFGRVNPVHQMVATGTDHAAADGVYEFLLVAPALVIPGAVGSPVNPQAIK